MNRRANFLFSAFTVTGSITGIVISALFNIDIRIGLVVGLVAGAALAYKVPGLFATIKNANEQEYARIKKENRLIGFQAFIIHPTQLPTTLGFLWLFVFFGVAFLSSQKITVGQQLLGLLPPLILFGLSGLVMIIRKEHLSGRFPPYVINRDSSAILLGILVLLFGWGMGIALIIDALIK